jgi:hypothetical protein
MHACFRPLGARWNILVCHLESVPYRVVVVELDPFLLRRNPAAGDNAVNIQVQGWKQVRRNAPDEKQKDAYTRRGLHTIEYV